MIIETEITTKTNAVIELETPAYFQDRSETIHYKVTEDYTITTWGSCISFKDKDDYSYKSEVHDAVNKITSSSEIFNNVFQAALSKITNTLNENEVEPFNISEGAE